MDIIILDKQEITREGLRSILNQYPDCGRICLPEEDKQLVQELIHCPESAVFLDYTLMSLTSEQLLVMNQRFPKAHFVLFCDNLSKDFARRILLTNKRFHILLKDSTLQEIHQAYADIRNGRQFVNQKLLIWMETSEKNEKSPLTATEKEILKAMSLGKTTKEIATERYSSVYTVMTHRKNIFRKLDVNNAQEAVRYAVQAGIVDVMEYYI